MMRSGARAPGAHRPRRRTPVPGPPPFWSTTTGPLRVTPPTTLATDVTQTGLVQRVSTMRSGPRAPCAHDALGGPCPWRPPPKKKNPSTWPAAVLVHDDRTAPRHTTDNARDRRNPDRFSSASQHDALGASCPLRLQPKKNPPPPRPRPRSP